MSFRKEEAKFGVVMLSMARFRISAILAAVLMFAAAAPVVQAAEAVYRLGPGDRVKVTVFGHEDLSGDFEVDGSGRLSLPLIQKIQAADLSIAEVETEIKNKLKPDYLRNPRVSVEVLNYRPYYILGEVKKPGSYPYVNGMTVVYAVASAGGYTYRARENRVTILRSNGADKKPTPADHNTVVLPGDVIEVPERFF